MQAEFLKESLDRVDYTPGADVVAGTPVWLNGQLCVATGNLSSGVLSSVARKGEFWGVLSAVTVTAGDLIGWDANGDPYGGTAGTGCFTNVLASMDYPAGLAKAAATNTSGKVLVDLNEFPSADIVEKFPLQSHIADAAQTQDTITDSTGGTANTTLADVLAAQTQAGVTDSSGGTVPDPDDIVDVLAAQTQAGVTDGSGGVVPDPDNIVAMAGGGADALSDAEALKANANFATLTLAVTRNTADIASIIGNTNNNLATLTLAVTRNTADIASVIGNTNDDFADLAAQLAKIKTDVGVCNTKINAILVALETAGIVKSA